MKLNKEMNLERLNECELIDMESVNGGGIKIHIDHSRTEFRNKRGNPDHSWDFDIEVGV